MAAVVLLASTLALNVVVRGLMGVPIEGSQPLFFAGAALYLFATTSLGIFLATLARSMPQFGMLLLLMLVPAPVRRRHAARKHAGARPAHMLAAPTTHFVVLSQAILYRGAGLEVIWPQLISLALIGSAFFAFSLARFRKTLAAMG